MNHLGASIGLLIIVGDGDGIKFAHTVIAIQHAAGVFPRNRRACFHLRPADFGSRALAQGPLGHEVINAAPAFGIAGIPVLHRGIFNLGIIERDELHNGGVELIFIAHWRGAAFEIRDIAALICDNQRALKLARIFSIDAEIGAQLHGAADAFGNVDKGPIRKDCAIERGKIIVAHRHDFAEPFFDQLGIFADRL